MKRQHAVLAPEMQTIHNCNQQNQGVTTDDQEPNNNRPKYEISWNDVTFCDTSMLTTKATSTSRPLLLQNENDNLHRMCDVSCAR